MTACGAGGSQTDCGLDGCITAKLVGVDAGSATISVAGQTVTVPVGGQSQVNGFSVGVERVTDADVVMRVRPGGGGWASLSGSEPA